MRCDMTSEISFLKREFKDHPRRNWPDYKSNILRSPKQVPLPIEPSRSVIYAPIFEDREISKLDSDLIHNFGSGGSPIGERIIVHGKVIDQYANPLPHALIEIWQANAAGRYRHGNDNFNAPLDPNFAGCGRMLTSADGSYSFRTIKPGAYPWPNGGNNWRPSHIHFSVIAHGLPQRLVTQMYFEGDPLISQCPIINAVESKDALHRLIAPLDMKTTIPFEYLAYRFDIVLRGENTHVSGS